MVYMYKMYGPEVMWASKVYSITYIMYAPILLADRPLSHPLTCNQQIAWSQTLHEHQETCPEG